MKLEDLYGSEKTFYDTIIRNILFRVKCCIPGIVQSYDPVNNTAVVQPAIREKMLDENNVESFINIPLLLDVPVVFPGTSRNVVKFPIKRNDEVVVIFSDLSIDNFWKYGSVQNPIENRRHDLSDGIAIPCNLSVPMNSIQPASYIEFTDDDISFHNRDSQITLTELLEALNEG